jgi:hypothetical protein
MESDVSQERRPDGDAKISGTVPNCREKEKAEKMCPKMVKQGALSHED